MAASRKAPEATSRPQSANKKHATGKKGGGGGGGGGGKGKSKGGKGDEEGAAHAPVEAAVWWQDGAWAPEAEALSAAVKGGGLAGEVGDTNHMN